MVCVSGIVTGWVNLTPTSSSQDPQLQEVSRLSMFHRHMCTQHKAGVAILQFGGINLLCHCSLLVCHNSFVSILLHNFHAPWVTTKKFQKPGMPLQQNLCKITTPDSVKVDQSILIINDKLRCSESQRQRKTASILTGLTSFSLKERSVNTIICIIPYFLRFSSSSTTFPNPFCVNLNVILKIPPGGLSWTGTATEVGDLWQWLQLCWSTTRGDPP